MAHDAGCRMQTIGIRERATLVSGLWMLVSGCWMLVSGASRLLSHSADFRSRHQNQWCGRTTYRAQGRPQAGRSSAVTRESRVGTSGTSADSDAGEL